MKNGFLAMFGFGFACAVFAAMSQAGADEAIKPHKDSEVTLLIKEDFEQAEAQSVPGWRFVRNEPEGEVEWGIVSDASRGKCLRIAKLDSKGHDHVWLDRTIDVSPGTKYTVSVKAKGWGGDYHSVAVICCFIGQEGKWLGHHPTVIVSCLNGKYPSATIPDVKEWKDFSGTVTPPLGTVKMFIRLDLDATSPSEAYFDDVQVFAPKETVSSYLLKSSPAKIPVFKIGMEPVSANNVTLVPDWTWEGAEIRQSASRWQGCLNGLWAIQPAEFGLPPREGDWAFMKVPGFLHPLGIYSIYGQDRTSWAKTNVQVAKNAPAVWYARDITTPKIEGRIFFEFHGMPSRAVRAYWNGVPVGVLTDQMGGKIDLSSFARPGEKGQLALYAAAVNAEGKYSFLMESGKMARNYDYDRVSSHGFLDVFLAAEPEKPVLSSARVMPSVRRRELAVRIVPSGNIDLSSLSYRLVVKDLKGNAVKDAKNLKVETREGMSVIAVSWADPHLWNPDDPYLYQFQVSAYADNGTLVDETVPVRFGFREVWVDGRNLILNGFPLRLRPRLSNTMYLDAVSARREFSFLKDVGFNCIIRPTAGMTYELEVWSLESPEAYYNTADEMGMLVIPYVPYSLVSGGQFGDSAIEKTKGELLFQYLDRKNVHLANHPSVVAYSGFGAGYWEGINTVNPRPDVWGITPLHGTGVLDKVLSDPQARKKAMQTIRASRKFITDFKRLDPSRPFLSHYDGGEGDGWGIFDYFNWTPLQEWEEWPEAWSERGIMPIGSTEHGLPYASSFLNHGIPDGDYEPWLTEYSAMLFGDVVYAREPSEYLLRIKNTYNPKTKTFPPKTSAMHNYAHELCALYPDNVQDVWASRNKAIYRAWRTYGLPMGIEPFGRAEQFYKMDYLKKGHLQVVASAQENLKTTGAKLDRWFFNGNWPSNSMPWLPTAPTSQKPAGLTPLGETLYEVNSPFLGYIAGKPERFTSKDHVFWSGEKISKQIALVWDGFRERRLNVSWKSVADGSEIARGSRTVVLAPGEIRFLPVEFSAPVVDIRKTGRIEMNVSDAESGLEVVVDHFDFQVHPSWNMPKELKGLRLVLFDPAGGSADAFRRLGFSFSMISRLSDWKDGDILVIGRKALPDMAGQSLDGIPANVPVLVLEQTAQDLEKIGFRAFPTRTRTVFPIGDNYPIMQGLGAEELCDWRVNPKLLPSGVEPLRDGYNYHTGYYGTVASVTIETPTRGAFTPLLQTGFDLRETPLLEMKSGGRRWIFAQLSLLDPLEEASDEPKEVSLPAVDPVAARLLGNILVRIIQPINKPVHFSVIGGDADLRLAGDLGAPDVKSLSSLADLGASGVVMIGTSGKNNPDIAALAQWVNGGGTAVVLPQDDGFYKTALPGEEVRAAKGSLFQVPAGSAFAGLGAGDFHYRQALPVLTFGKIASTAAEIPAGKGRWIVLGFDPRKLDLQAEPYLRLTSRHQYRALAQILGNLGVSLETPSASVVRKMGEHDVKVDISAGGDARIAENKAAGNEWAQPGFDDSPWDEFSLKTKQTPYGDALMRIRFRVSANAAGQNLVADLGTMDDYDESYLNGVKIGSINPANSQPDTAFGVKRVYPIPSGLLKSGAENLLAVRAWNRNAESKGWKAWIRGPMSIRPADVESIYVGTYKHSDDPYLQRHW